jgi:hypothetical protein
MAGDPDLALDVDALRADTSGLPDTIHFDNAGSSLPPKPVTDAVIAHLRRESQVGGYRAEDEHRAQLDDTYAACAALVGAQPDEIALVESATIGRWRSTRSGSPTAIASSPARTSTRATTSTISGSPAAVGSQSTWYPTTSTARSMSSRLPQ